jgi:GNAT superfamily N-acetyltransferase
LGPQFEQQLPSLTNIPLRNKKVQKSVHDELTRSGYHEDDPMHDVVQRRLPLSEREGVILAHDSSGVIGALRHERSIAFWNEDPKVKHETQIREMRVHSEAQGGGHGRALIEAAAHHAWSTGTDLSVKGVVNSARPFYERTGAYNPWAEHNPNVTDSLRWRSADVEAMAKRHLGRQWESGAKP